MHKHVYEHQSNRMILFIPFTSLHGLLTHKIWGTLTLNTLKFRINIFNDHLIIHHFFVVYFRNIDWSWLAVHWCLSITFFLNKILCHNILSGYICCIKAGKVKLYVWPVMCTGERLTGQWAICHHSYPSLCNIVFIQNGDDKYTYFRLVDVNIQH